MRDLESKFAGGMRGRLCVSGKHWHEYAGAWAGRHLRTVWKHGERSYSLAWRPPERVSEEEDNVLTAFLESERPLTTKELERETENVSRVMRQLAARFPNAVRRPGKRKKGAGYHIQVRQATP